MKKILLSAAVIAMVTTANAKTDLEVLKGQLETMSKKIDALEAEKSSKSVASSTASTGNGITIINQESPDFLLGKETHINMKFVPEDASDMWFKAGVRIQGTLESASEGDGVKIQDAYLRRVRLEVAAGFGKHTSFVMDIRNDKSNYGIENTEGDFNVGDAYLKIKKPFDTSLVNFKLYRAKIDVSRTETVKSARVISYDRPFVADYAAQYISFNRRGANVQMYGDWNKKIHYQIAMGAASSPDKALDAAGIKGSKVGIDLEKQSFFYGGKVVLSPFDGWEETLKTETYMGVGKHFSIGASYWVVPEMIGTATTDAGTANFDLKRKLLNLEVSGHYGGFFAQAEYFKFDDMVKSWNVNGNVETGTSDGWYATAEYVMPEFNYIAPFVRYESWDRWNDEEGYEVTSATAGINWYLRGNTTKVGFAYQKNEYGESTGNRTEDIFRITSQWFF